MKKKTKKKSSKRHLDSAKTTVSRQHKDRLFRFLFNDRKHLLELYNALNGTDYHNENELTITTLEGTIYMNMKNDLSFIVDSAMNLYEHQSTWNPNMPLRGLIYFSRLYQIYVKSHDYNLYGNRKIPLPFPQYVVFYNGTKEHPDRSELLLSDSFFPPSHQAEKPLVPCLECRAVMLNINQGHNKELMEKCHRLWEYSKFISQIRENRANGMDLSDSVNTAIDRCLKNGILTDVLTSSKMEVLDMLLEEYNEQKTREYLRREALEEGQEIGSEKINALNRKLIMENRLEDLKRAANDKAYQEKLLEEYQI